MNAPSDDTRVAHQANQRVFDERAAGYQRSAWFGGTSRSIYAYEVTRKRLLQALDLHGTESVLEIGCGPGTWTRVVAPLASAVTAIDISEQMLHYARRYVQPYDVQFVHSDAVEYRPGRTFDRVLSVRVIEYVLDKPALFSQLAQLVSDDGRLVVITKNPMSAWGIRRVYWWLGEHIKRARRLLPLHSQEEDTASDTSHYMRRLAPWQMARLLRDAGFTEVSFTPVTVGLPVFSGSPGEVPIIPRKFAPLLLERSNRLSDRMAGMSQGIRMGMLWLAESYCVSASKVPMSRSPHDRT